jgi:hypothetical protein
MKKFQMKNLYLYLLFSFFIQISFAQKKCNIIYCKAYATTIFPGMVMVDNNGNEIPQQTTFSRKIYINTKCNIAPIVTNVLYDKIKAKCKVKAIFEKEIELGNDNAGKKIIVSSSKTNYLWEIEIDLGEINVTPEKVKSIIINGTNNKKAFKLILKEINIVPLVMPV